MTGGNNIIGLRPNGPKRGDISDVDLDAQIANSSDGPSEDAGQEYYEAEWDDETPARDWPTLIVRILLVSAAVGWVVLCAYAWSESLSKGLPTPADAVTMTVQFCVPLALLSLGWMLFSRNSKAEAKRIGATVALLQQEEARLRSTLASVAGQIEGGRTALAGESALLAELGNEAAGRIHAASDAMRSEIDNIARHANTLKTSATAARTDMAVLLSELPKAQVQARQMTTELIEAGVQATEKASMLEERLAELRDRGREASDFAGGAAHQLAAYLSQIKTAGDDARETMAESAQLMTQSVDDSLSKASEALSAAREGLEAQGSALLALADQAQSTMASAGADAGEAIAQRIATATAQVDELAARFEAQKEASAGLVTSLDSDLAAIEGRFASLGSEGSISIERASAAILGLRDHADAMHASLEGGGSLARDLISQAETLLVALDAATRELDETLPASLGRLTSDAAAAQSAAQSAQPVITSLEASGAATLERIERIGSLVEQQQAALEALVSTTQANLEQSRNAVEALNQAIAGADTQARTLAEVTAPKAASALSSIGAEAGAAAEKARDALAEVVPYSAKSLADQSREALTSALTQQVEEQMAVIAHTTESAVAAAQKATDRLMRQLLTISETSSALEARIAEAKQEVEGADQSNFARRIALLVESLNSTSIDVAKILSNDVTDSAWASYLRGDRGVFTRRAVRLLDAGEAREISRHYDDDTEFREHVNRYIHDFEAMLRNVLSTRDGGPLSVTLLSSDAGKLYVALAQAIDRLRN